MNNYEKIIKTDIPGHIHNLIFKIVLEVLRNINYKASDAECIGIDVLIDRILMRED